MQGKSEPEASRGKLLREAAPYGAGLAIFMWAEAEAARAAARRMVLAKDMAVDDLVILSEDVDFVPDEIAKRFRFWMCVESGLK